MKRRLEIVGMSGKPNQQKGGPSPQAPLRPKIQIRYVPKPKLDEPTASGLTVVASDAAVVSEDKRKAPSVAAVPKRVGMFSRETPVAGLSAPGKGERKPVLTRAERVARPLMADSDEENENEENELEAVRRVAEEETPVPPPPKPKVTVVAPPPPPPPKAEVAVLPSVAKQFMGMAIRPERKSYSFDAVKRRLTDETAATLIELGKQLEELTLGGLDLAAGTGVTKEAESIGEKSKFTFDNEQSFAEPLTEAKLTALDDLFRTLQLRMTYVLGKGSLEEEGVPPLSQDRDLLFKLISYAPSFAKDKPKFAEKERLEGIKLLLTDSIVQTLLDIETNLNEMMEGGTTLNDMKVTEPESEGKPYVYEFEDGNTFLVVEDEGAKEKEEARLKELWPLFPGGTKITLTKIVGMGPLDEQGTPLQSDIQLLTELFGLAKQYKQKAKVGETKAAALAAEEEAKRVKTLEGTPYEELAGAIQDEFGKSPYEVTTDSTYTPGKYTDRTGKEATLPAQQGFIPSTRRAFGYFILDKFRRYMLEPLEKLDPNACQAFGDSSSETQIYQYQKFVRDYISFMTPYRGVLVYHGLGSGKTCTAIAASEALLASGGKQRIIIMTPFSLRKNFIQQITFCGFRHFRLLNHWTPHEYRASDGKNALWLFATTVMRIPETYMMARRGKPLRIWIPDLNKPQSEENYTKLGGAEQAEIRDQIYETLVFDPDKKKNGLIWFLNYNGISASKLRDLACKPTYDVFDNAVIVVDEIHNLVRLMQGTVDPYLKKITEGELKAESTKQSKFLDPDRFTSNPWHPKYCGRTMNYKRGYLFYRLLVGAKNTKIIGLSGTPLINFPEELGILANVLHGYNYIYKATMQKVKETNGDKRIVDGLKSMAEGNDASNFCPYIDFHEGVINDRLATIEFTFTFLPEGYRKIQGQLGVERIPFTETLLTTAEKLDLVKACITNVMKSVNPIYSFTGTINETAEPLLPVMGEPSIPDNPALDDSFKGRFVSPTDGTSIVNGQVLFKRLSGLISYYKGSRKDLMPEVKEGDDTIVMVPMSLDQQKKYNAIRLAEIQVEKRKEQQQRQGAAAAKGDDAELKKLSSSQNYRMASRQACNFVFPDGFTRPRPMTAEQAKQADEFGGNPDQLAGEDQAPEASALVRSKQEEDEATAEARQEAEQARQEDDAVSRQQEAEEIEAEKTKLRAQGKAEGEIQLAVKAIQDRYEQERQGGLLLASAIPGATEEPREALSPQQKRCLANMLDGESYQAAINRAKECLSTMGAANLLLKDPRDPERSPLGRWSPKYKAILENIEGVNGSSLVYSQFLGMEGIGIFTIVMKANGYVPIKVVSRGGEFVLDEETEASIRKGPAANEKRFILFTGGEEEEIRKTNIDIFNAKYSELPSKIKEVLLSSGFTNEVGNKKGELCRVFCITAAGAEGLSLKNVRGVHIMEPYWNDVRMAQVKGRAIRICSHQELPLSERNVKIYTYITVYSREAQEAKGDPREGEKQKWAIPQEIWNRDGINRATAESYGISTTRDDYALTSDERLYYISEKKKKLVENLIILMKSAAADCTLNYKQNMDGTFICRMLGNEGDFLYHPSLQRDFELNKRDEMGDLFTVPPAEKEKVKAALAKLTFEEKEEDEEEEEEEASKPKAEEEEAPKPPAKAEEEEEAPKPKAEVPKPKAAEAPKPKMAAPKRISYTIAATTKAGEKKQFVVSALPMAKANGSVTVSEFLVYDKADTGFTTPVGKAQAVLKDGKWIPKAGTVKVN